jgi:NADPH:quinone reductase-like Zn-dependent oxidoreductase
MRAAVITKHGPPDVIKIQEMPAPTPGEGEVLIDVKAIGINFADVMARLGLYPDAPKPPCVIGYELAGTIAALGPGVSEPAVGTRVMAGTKFNGYAEQVAVPAADAIPLPDSLSFEQGAAIPVNYSTAWAGLIRYGSLEPGERVLLHAAAGGVGIAGTQIAKRHGAEVYGTASPGKHEAIRGFGVDHPVDYTRSGWEDGLPKFDVIMDAIAGKSFKISYDLLRPGGRMVCIGAASAVSGDRRNLLTAGRMVVQTPRFNILKQMSASKAVIGLNMLTLWKDRGTLEPWITPLRALIEDGTIKPVIAETFPLEKAGEAQSYLARRRNVGKVVLVP